MFHEVIKKITLAQFFGDTMNTLCSPQSLLLWCVLDLSNNKCDVSTCQDDVDLLYFLWRILWHAVQQIYN